MCIDLSDTLNISYMSSKRECCAYGHINYNCMILYDCNIHLLLQP